MTQERKKKASPPTLYLWLPIFFLTIHSACASNGKDGARRSPPPRESQAEGASYVADYFTFDKKTPQHPAIRPWQFFFKKCELTGEENSHSPNTYQCTGPCVQEANEL